MEANCELHASAIYHQVEAPDTHWAGDLVNRWAVPDAVSGNQTSVVQPVC